MKRSLIFFLVLVLSVSLFASCKDSNNSSGGSNNSANGTADNNKEPTGGSGVIWAQGVGVNIVMEDGLEFDPYDLSNMLQSKTGVSPKVGYESSINSAGIKSEREIVIGNTKRSVTKRAVIELEKITNTLDEKYGYVIYAYNGSLSLVFNNQYAFEDAVAYLEKMLSDDNLASVEDGVVKKDSFYLRERIAEIRNEKRNEALDALTPELGNDTVLELKKLFSLYSEELYIWIANLYDPETGGFYFSNSGRDNQGFLPDIESTDQALRHLEEAGMFVEYGNNYGKALPDEIKEQILGFAKGLQSSEDGYFYHPQWGKNIIDARLSRDLGWATNIITKLGGQPYWNAPGTPGEYGAPGPDAVLPTAHITSPLKMSVASAVSKIIPTGAGDSSVALPDYLQSISAWDAYITSQNITGDPYTAGNTLASQHEMISAAGKDYEDHLINRLNACQNSETGAWHDETLTEPFEIANGLMKISMIYRYFSATIPYAENALKTAMDIIMTDGDYHVCCIYNPWVVIDGVLKSIEASDGEARAEELRMLVRENAPELIEKTREKMLKYMVEGGGFHYHLDQPTHYSQKAHVACSTTMEADVNATSVMSNGLINYIFDSLGAKRVYLWYEEDCDYFMDLLTGLQPVIKNPIPEPKTEKFDGYEAQYGEERDGIVYVPGANAAIVVDEAVAGIRGDRGNSKYFAVGVVQDPKPYNSNDLALKINQYTYSDGEDIAASPLTAVFSIENYAMVSDCYILETDMLIKEGANTFAQLFFYNNAEQRSDSFSLNFAGYTVAGVQYLRISDNYLGLDNERNTSIVEGIPFDEWFNLRIELYKIYAVAEAGDGKMTLEIKAKIYINDKFVGESEAARVNAETNTVADKVIGAAGFMTYRYTSSEFYLDNTVVFKAEQSYIKETVSLDADVILPEATGERGTGVYYNSADAVGKRFNFRLSRGESEFYSVKVDEEGNKVWGPTTAGKITLTRQEDGAVYFFRTNDSDSEFYANYSGDNIIEALENQAFIFEQDIVFTGLEKKAQTGVYRLEVNCGPAFGYGFEIHLSEDADGNIIFTESKIIDKAAGFAGIAQDEWTNLRFEVYGTTNKNTKIKVYVNGEYALTIEPDVWYSTTYSTKVRFWVCAPADDKHGIMLDNLYIGSVSKVYVSEEKDIPTAEGTHEGGSYYNNQEGGGVRVDYSDGVTYNEFYQNNPNTSKPTAGKLGIINDENAAMYIIRKDNSGEKFFAGYRNTAITTSTEISNHAAIVEQDIAFVGLEAEKEKAYYLEIFTGSTDGIQAYIYLGTDADGKIKFSDKVAHTAEGYTPMEIGKWYNLRFELYSDGMCKVYIDGEYALTLELTVSKSTLNRMEVRYWVCAPVDDKHGLILDNLYIGADSKVYVDEGGDSQLPETGEGGGENPDPTDPSPDGSEGGTTDPEPDGGEGGSSAPTPGGSLSNGSNMDDEAWEKLN